MRELLGIVKALADKNRLRALYALRERELCVCQITEFLGLAQSTVSKHMAILYHAKLVESRKEGRWIYYRLPGKGASAEVRKAMAWLFRCLETSPDIQEDRKRLKYILKIDPVELCKRQNQS